MTCQVTTAAPTTANPTPTVTSPAPAQTTASPAPTQTQTTAPAQGTSGFVALAPIPGLTSGTTAVVNPQSLDAFFNNLYKFLIGIAAMLAIIEIIWGGLEYSTQDSVSKKSDGKQRITQALLGLVLVLSPVLVFSIINPSILNLSLNLPALNTAPVTATPETPVTPADSTPVPGGQNYQTATSYFPCASFSDCTAASNLCAAKTPPPIGGYSNASYTAQASKVCLSPSGALDDQVNSSFTNNGDLLIQTGCAPGDTPNISCSYYIPSAQM